MGSPGPLSAGARHLVAALCVLLASIALALVSSDVAGAVSLAGPGPTKIKEKPRRFVPIPDSVPHREGAYIDRRLKGQLRWLAANFKIYVTEGFAGRLPNGTKIGCPKCHVKHSEHKIGLAVDIVALKTDWSGRCTKAWRSVTKLAKLAEPSQNQPLPPFRWVGYNKDSGHGCGHHLHLSWSHHPKYRKFKPSRWVEVFKVRSPSRQLGAAPAAAEAIEPPPPGALPIREPS